MKNKVYIVTGIDGYEDQRFVLGVYSSEEKAKESFSVLEEDGCFNFRITSGVVDEIFA